ncbi:SRPBCC family protein [Nocardioides sp. Soil796]|uniref:SRPBCC family protein n=1 Tax=Nocardioides sp. Soil796 TaxID=1736412 RepID=UPI00070EB3A2|nr:SRPBCC family protein [Nocardioides sp. Soil796]KRF14519.1 carbon monoxide dehydrogenase [Nocardioides sp. Soil796]
MQLTHEFTVPASRAETWAAFNDIESVAGCFPGATVTSFEGDTFTGSCKVKLGPIALVYNGSGSFTEKDESAGVMKIKAMGKDKRGNGTAGADVVATMSEAGPGETRVEVVTDLNITGKPAQFGRGVIQDISDKLLGQFVDCLKTKVGGTPEPDADSEPASVPTGAAAVSAPGGDPDAGPASSPAAESSAAPAPQASTPSRHKAESSGSSGSSGSDDALDLGATVLPILLKTYGKQLAAALGVLALVVWITRRRCC